jgi:hypothetical protein
MSKSYRNLFEKFKGRDLLKDIARYTQQDNIKMDLREIWHQREDWIKIIQDRVQWWAFVN